jgi:Uma2 family endonuclease
VATVTQLSPAEYVRTSFSDLDKEYVHGEIVERSMPDDVHSALQFELGNIFAEVRKQGHQIWVRPELRLQLQNDLFRIPDICVFTEKPARLVPDVPPLIAIEIVSKDDRHTELLEKLEEYRRFGIPNVWVVDPWLRRLSIWDEAGLRTVTELTSERLGVRIHIEELLSSIE